MTLYSMSLSRLSSISHAGSLGKYITPTAVSNISVTIGSYITGVATTNDVSYNVYALTSSSTGATTHTISYTCNTPTLCYVLAVGGGGGGSSYAGGGGGADGVVMMPVTLPVGTSTISVSVGNYGVGAVKNGLGVNGSNTTVNFTATSVQNIIATGGGRGAGSSGTAGNAGGSGGGGCSQFSAATGVGGAGNNANNNFANYGGSYTAASSSSGGGGAGSFGTIGIGGLGGNGGIGIKCSLAGIANFTPSGTSYGTYYWGGGGGTMGGIGGLGGGGNGGTGTTVTAANSVTNTGGGGGGGYNAIAGNGGSGIVVIAFPTTAQSMPLTNYSFTSPIVTSNSASVVNPTITSWTITNSGTYYILNGTGGATYNFNACPYGQFFFNSTSFTVALRQTIVLAAKTYTLSFCSAVNSSYTDNNSSTNIYVDNLLQYTTFGTITTTSTSWNVYTFNFTINIAGSHEIWINSNCSIGITQILIY